MSKNNWTDDFLAISTVVVPMTLILLSVLTPRSLVSDNQKDTLLTAGITALVTGGLKGIGKKTEINQEVQTQEMNMSPSTDYYQYNPPAHKRGVPEGNYAPYQPSYLSQVPDEDAQYLVSREPMASSPHRIVSPDED